MLTLSILLFLMVFFLLWLKNVLSRSFWEEKDNYIKLKAECAKLDLENEKAKEKNAVLTDTLEERIALYNITKDICKSLEEEKVFENFNTQVNRYIRKDCKFLKYGTDISAYKDYTVLPLDIDKSPIGYLAIANLKEQDKDKFYILSQQFLLGIKRAILYQKVQELAITDTLTGAFSRRYLLERLTEEMERSKKFNYKFSFLMIDVDNFKDHNDRYGHLVGDAILKEVANIIRENIRQIDLLGRYGGEEFSIILTETDKQQVRIVAERIRQAIESRVVRVYDENLKVTISIGISIFPEDAEDALTLIDTADKALYQAKEKGRNCICIYGVDK